MFGYPTRVNSAAELLYELSFYKSLELEQKCSNFHSAASCCIPLHLPRPFLANLLHVLHTPRRVQQCSGRSRDLIKSLNTNPLGFGVYLAHGSGPIAESWILDFPVSSPVANGQIVNHPNFQPLKDNEHFEVSNKSGGGSYHRSRLNYVWRTNGS